MKASSVDCAAESNPPEPAATLCVCLAKGFLARARGLIGRPPPAPGCGLLLSDVNAVHGFGMRYPIDLLFLDAGGIIVACAHLAPARIVRYAGARHVVELREGEIARLALRRGMRLRLVPAQSTQRHTDGTRRAPFFGILVASFVAGWAPDAALRAAPPDAATAPVGSPPPLALARPLAAQTLRQLKDEAETLYRDEGRRATGDAELIRLYESLAELGDDRVPHAWLRIGNIHQRAGSVGAAIDAYRRLLAIDSDSGSVSAPDAAAAERKALLNLAGLALDQARQSLARLESMAAMPGATAARAVGDRPPGSQVHTEAAIAIEPYNRQLRSLAQQLSRHRLQQDDQTGAGTDAQAAATTTGQADGDAAYPPYVVERYTASARRNAVKSAKGSLHVDPADGLPARPVSKPRRRAPVEALPTVEYLLGDPHRSKPANDRRAVPGNGRAGAGAGTAAKPKR
jgi:uncharacterized membrane protein (UPF0127 family)